jgi:CO/xanthine dehydrogenase Mo-binding subunit
MALGWVCSEGLAVDPDSGEVLDLTIRSFGVIRPAHTPPIDVTIVDDPLPPQARASDAVFAAVAAATWNAITKFEGTRPEIWPARATAAARALRR